MAKIVLTRPTGYKTDRLRPYQIYIDGQKVGHIKPGQAEAFEVPAGQHELRLKVDWGASEALKVDLGENDEEKFVCGPRVKQNDVTIAAGYRQAYWSTFGCRRYIDLRSGDKLGGETESRSKLHGLDGPMLFGIALLIGVAYWILTGRSIVLVGVVVAAMALVVGGLVGRGIGKATVQVTEEVQKHRDG